MPSRRVLCVKVFLAFVFINRAVVARSMVLWGFKCLPPFACSHEIIDLRLLTVHHKTLVLRIINIHSIVCKLIEILNVMAGRNRINTILCAVKKSGTNLRSLIYGVWGCAFSISNIETPYYRRRHGCISRQVHSVTSRHSCQRLLATRVSTRVDSWILNQILLLLHL